MSERYLRSGIFLAPFHDLPENPTLALERDMELLQLLDRLNYHEAWIGEHHSGGFEIVGSPEIFIAAAAERTRHIRLGTGVVSLPYHNPFLVADRIVQLDHMTRGRAMLGVGPGSLVHDAMKMGIKPADQRRRMNESLDVIVELLDGKPNDLRDVVLDLDGVPEFHRGVYDIARNIPPGKTMTYGDIAKRLGGVELSRDVGQALGRNPCPIVVPCHRVLAAGGKPGGFSANGGVVTKLKMLAIEGAYVNHTPSLFD